MATAQTTSDFEGVSLPGPDTAYLETQYPVNGVHTFTSGNALFYGQVSWGSSWSDFNCSNATDTVQASYTKAAAAIPGKGYDGSSKYAIAFVPIDFMGPDPTATIPVGAKLQGAAAGKQVFGAYFTNSVFAYRYMLDGNKYANNNFWLKLIIRGYNNGVKSADSVLFTLADYSGAGGNPVLVNTWEWVNLTSLGNVDSLTFDLISNDNAGGFGINTPAYFAMDNLVTSDGACPEATGLAVSAITESGAQLNWAHGMTGITPGYEVAVDQSATLAPTGTVTNVTGTTHTATGLNGNTTYYAHIRTACGSGSYSPWDTLSFKTQAGTGLFDTPDYTLAAGISPNPASSILNITAPVAVNATIYRIEGRPVLEQKNVKTIDISRLANGLYLIKITELQGASSRTLRFTKTH